MKANHLVLGTQFKVKLKQILQKYPGFSAHLNEFVEILRKNCIKFYSKEDIIKINKIFDNPLKIAKLDYAISFLQLICVQTNQNLRYFVVRTSLKPLKYQVKKVDVIIQHQVKRCFDSFKKIMSKLYGSQINWFKNLGGVTIAVKIDKNTFQRNLSKVLNNTQHSHCSQKLTKLFLRPDQYEIQWSYFMEIIRQRKSIKTNQSNSTHKQSFRIYQLDNQNEVTQRINQNKPKFYNYMRKNKQKKHSFSINSKACHLYQRNKSYSQSIRPKTQASKIQRNRVISFKRNERLNKTTNSNLNILQKSDESQSIKQWNTKINIFNKFKIST